MKKLDGFFFDKIAWFYSSIKNLLLLKYIIFIVLFILTTINTQAQNPSNVVEEKAIQITTTDDLAIDTSCNFLLEDTISKIVEENAPMPQIEREINYLNVNNILCYLFFIILAIYAFVSWRYADFWEVSRRSLLNSRLAKLFFEEKENQYLLPSILLHLNSALIVGILVFCAMRFYGFENNMNASQVLLYAILITVSFFALKYFIQLLLGWILPLAYTIRFYLYQKLLIQSLLGLCLLPIVVLYVFNPSFQISITLIVGIGVIVLASLFLIYKGVTTNLLVIAQYPLHFFLYLCTLEIAPLLIMWKWHI